MFMFLYPHCHDIKNFSNTCLTILHLLKVNIYKIYVGVYQHTTFKVCEYTIVYDVVLLVRPLEVKVML